MIAEIKRAVFRALTRFRTAAVKEFDPLGDKSKFLIDLDEDCVAR